MARILPGDIENDEFINRKGDLGEIIILLKPVDVSDALKSKISAQAKATLVIKEGEYQAFF